MYKRGAKSAVLDEAAASVGDEEKPSQAADEVDTNADQKEVAAALKEQKPMTDVFSWQHLEYTVPVPGGERRLLDDVSGFVAPGKLTALMGESGAGKVGFFYWRPISYAHHAYDRRPYLMSSPTA